MKAAAVLVAASQLLGVACAEQPRVPVGCRQVLDHALPGWSIPRPSEEEQEWSNSENLDPAVAIGDFDGNGRADVGVLVLHEDKRKLALCLRVGNHYRTLVIADSGCSDVIFTVLAKTRDFDLEAQAFVTLRHDGVAGYCVGKAGETWVLESGKLRRITDSD